MEKRRAVGRHEVYERTHKKKKGQGDFVTDKSKDVYVSTILIIIELRWSDTFCFCVFCVVWSFCDFSVFSFLWIMCGICISPLGWRNTTTLLEDKFPQAKPIDGAT